MIFPLRRSPFGIASRVIIVALFLQMTAAVDTRLSVHRTNFHVESARGPDDPLPLDSHQSLDDQIQIQLQIVEQEIQQFAVIFSQQYEDNQIRYTQDTSRPSLSRLDSNKLVQVENVIGKFQSILDRLNASRELSTQDKSRIAKLETTIDEEKKTLYMVRRHIEEGVLTPQNQDRLPYDVDSKTFGGNEEDIVMKLNKILLNGTVLAIQQRQFILAEEQLPMIDDGTQQKVVETVYNHNENNFDLLQNFGEYVSGADLKFEIFAALFNQMETNEHQDVRKLIQLGQSFIKYVLGRTKDDAAAQSSFAYLGDAIQTSAIDQISDSFLNDNAWSSTISTSSALVQHFPQLAQNIYTEVIDQVFDALGIQKIMNEAEQLDHLESLMLVHNAVFLKLDHTNALYTGSSAIILARGIKEVMTRNSYRYMSLHWKSQYESTKSKLPESVKNFLFLSDFCIKNSYYNEYLYADDMMKYGGYAYDDQRRSVYTWIPKNRTQSSSFKWYVSPIDVDGQFEIANKNYGEKLFGCKYSFYNGTDETRRMVFTFRLKGFSIENYTYWDVEVDGDGLQFRNVAVNEYIFADNDEKLDPARRYVFTHRPGGKRIESKWQITNCTEVF